MLIRAGRQCAALIASVSQKTAPSEHRYTGRTARPVLRRGWLGDRLGREHRPGGAPERDLANRQALDQKRLARYLKVVSRHPLRPPTARMYAIAWELMFSESIVRDKRERK
jgi:hypothetical protein